MNDLMEVDYLTSIEMVHAIAKLLNGKKAQDVTALEIKDLTTIGDYFVVASGSSPIQVKAMSDAVEEGLSALGLAPRRLEGYPSAAWIVLDYYEVIVHLFQEQSRQFYALERLWADAPRVPLEEDK